MTCKRDRLLRDAFHEAAVARDGEGVVPAQLLACARRNEAFRNRHADGVRDALAQRPRRRLDAGRVPVLGMPRRLGAELAEVLDLLHRHAGIAGEIEDRIEQHGAVSGRQDEAVAVGPIGIGRIERHRFREQHGRHIRHAERHARVTGVCLLDRVHRQGADGVCHVAETCFHRVHLRAAVAHTVSRKPDSESLGPPARRGACRMELSAKSWAHLAGWPARVYGRGGPSNRLAHA